MLKTIHVLIFDKQIIGYFMQTKPFLHTHSDTHARTHTKANGSYTDNPELVSHM